MSREIHINRAKQTKAQRSSSTLEKIVSVAEKEFAERGYGDVTSKHICELANVNTASVNYYFGSKKSLYEYVLSQALCHDFWKNVLNFSHTPGLNAEEKLKSFFKNMIRAASSPEARKMKLILREIIYASSIFNEESLIESEINQIKRNISAIIHHITGISIDSPEMNRVTSFIILPLFILVLEPEFMRAFNLYDANVQDNDIADDMVKYSLGGLFSLRETRHFEK